MHLGSLKSNSFSTVLAMFSMFFGAGNIVFPLAVGQHAQSLTPMAMLGHILTAVLVPFTGLMAMTLFEGHHKIFFQRIGKKSGFALALFIMSLIGPLGAMPRTVTLAYSTIKSYAPDLSLALFSLISCLIIFFFTYKRRRILDLLGYVLTPILLLSLGVIVIMGCLTGNTVETSSLSVQGAFIYGLTEGYYTMDLLGAFFFSSVVLVCLKAERREEHPNMKQLSWVALKSSLIGAFLLGAVYTGFSIVAAMHASTLEGVPLEHLIAVLAVHILGPYAGIVVCLAVTLACLTTAIALAAVFAEFLRKDVLHDRIGYVPALIATLVVMLGMCFLEFGGLVSFLAPILIATYPAMILLSLVNLMYKLYGFQPVKGPVLLTLLASLAWLGHSLYF
ncbi:MAG: branched-chain amino acid transport system II carrier protein [Chlamydiia bacterium]|nr:branched-chain amino acid transport system II carrier protein [Chlamydiia bacterium]